MRVALGVSGGVAAYKAAELVRRLQQEGIEVQVVMTRSAQEFITPLTFAALTGQKVITDILARRFRGRECRERDRAYRRGAADRCCWSMAPATANTIAKLARGIADDFLTTLYLATTAPAIVAPAMNVNMWEHAATQENLEMLRARGVHFVAPDEGYLACGMTGAGRLAGVEAIAHAVLGGSEFRRDLPQKQFWSPPGPPAKISIRFAISPIARPAKWAMRCADAAHRRGAKVILISGPVSIPAPSGVEFVSVRTAEEMRSAVRDRAARINCRDHGRGRRRFSPCRAGVHKN